MERNLQYEQLKREMNGPKYLGLVIVFIFGCLGMVGSIIRFLRYLNSGTFGWGGGLTFLMIICYLLIIFTAAFGHRHKKFLMLRYVLLFYAVILTSSTIVDLIADISNASLIVFTVLFILSSLGICYLASHLHYFRDCRLIIAIITPFFLATFIYSMVVMNRIAFTTGYEVLSYVFMSLCPICMWICIVTTYDITFRLTPTYIAERRK